jgi:hypothetical protein
VVAVDENDSGALMARIAPPGLIKGTLEHDARVLDHVRAEPLALRTRCWSRRVALLATQDVARTPRNGSFEVRLKKLSKVELLIVDDFAMRELTAAQADDFYELVSQRTGQPGRSRVLTSNRAPSDWYQLFPNAVVGESTLDRLINTSHYLLMEGRSYRPNRRPAARASSAR